MALGRQPPDPDTDCAQGPGQIDLQQVKGIEEIMAAVKRVVMVLPSLRSYPDPPRDQQISP
jgi:hypothetical protein